MSHRTVRLTRDETASDGGARSRRALRDELEDAPKGSEATADSEREATLLLMRSRQRPEGQDGCRRVSRDGRSRCKSRGCSSDVVRERRRAPSLGQPTKVLSLALPLTLHQGGV